MEDEGGWEVTTVKTRRPRSGRGRGKQVQGKPRSTATSGARGNKTTSLLPSKSWAKPVVAHVENALPKESPDQKVDVVHAVENSATDAPVVAPTFASGFMAQPLSMLLTEYGDYDPNWQKVEPTVEPETEVPDTTSSEPTIDRLAKKGKAPLHVDIISFGYRYGAPPIRRDGWSQTQPLHPFDSREVLPSVPHYLQFHDGISSGQVKRFLLYDFRRHAAEDETTPSVREYARDQVAPQIYQAIQEAVRQGSYGYALPLKMKIHIGSEWGRHRSVVAAEQSATALRRLLRKTKLDEDLHCPCSVATQHRDINRKIPNLKRDKDDDD